MRPVDLAAFVDRLATESGRAILPFFRASFATENKAGPGAFDPVTEADRAAEVVLRRMILDAFPEHGIVGEEFGSEREDAEFVWVLDPIDGTRAFVSGLPLWGTLIGLTRKGVPAYGTLHQPFIGERFTGDGGAARYEGPGGGRDLATRRCRAIEDATILTTSPKLFAGDEDAAYRRVEDRARLARYGTDCYGYAMVAAGQADAVVESGLKPYDIVALIPVVEGAGGIVTSWDGGSAAGGGRVVACGDRLLHAQILDILNG